MVRMKLAAAVVLAVFLVASVPGAASAYMPWRAMVKAGQDERKVSDIRDDKGLKREISEALSGDAGLRGADLNTSVYMGHAFVVGTVSDPAQERAVHDTVAGVQGVRSVNTYLPVKTPEKGNGTSGSGGGTGTAAEIKGVLTADPSVAATRYEVRMVQGAAVVMGVAGSDSERDRAVADIQGVSGVSHVVDFVLLPEPEYQKRVRERFGILR